MALPPLVAELVAKTDGFQASLTRAADTAVKSNARISSSFSGIERAAGFAKKALGAIGVGLSAAVVVDFFEKSLHAAKEVEQQITKLTLTYRNVGSAAGLSLRDIDQFAVGLSKTTQFDTGGLRNAASQILIFGKIHGETFKEALRTSTDLAAFMRTSVPEAAQQVASAMADPEKAMKLLKQAGVVLNEEQKDQLKHMIAIGDAAGAQKAILSRLQGTYHGFAEEMNTGLTKSSNDLSKAWHNMMEEVGKSFSTGDNNWSAFLTRRTNELTTFISLLDKSQGAANRGAASTRGKILPAGLSDEIARMQSIIDNVKPAGGATEDEKYARAKMNRAIDAALVQTHLGTQKDILAKSLAELDRFYSDGLVSESLYYKDRRGIVQRGLDAELKSISEGISAQEHIFNTGTSKEQISGAFVDLVKLSEQRKTVQRAASDQFQALTFADTKAARAFNAELEGIVATTMEQQGNRSGAAGLRFDTRNAEQLRKLGAESLSPDAGRASEASAAIAQLATQRQFEVSQVQLNDAELKFSQILDEVGIKRERINLAVQTGAKTELEGLYATSAANRERVADLTAVIQKFDALAQASKTPEAILAAQKLHLELEKLASQQDLVADKFREIGVSATENFLDKITSGTATMKDTFKAFFNDLHSEINKVVNRNLAQQLFGTGGAAGGFGSFLSKFFDGGGGFEIASAKGNVFAGGNVIPFARGGVVTGPTLFPMASGMGLMGEAGEEGILPLKRGSDGRLGVSAIGNGGGVTLNQTFIIQPGTSTASQQQIAAAAYSGAMRANMRNG